jgi:restriction system protein
MARTYRAEGQKLAKLLRRLFVFLAVVICYYWFPELHWGFYAALLVIGYAAAEALGALWTKKRREAGKSHKV